jgi:hypothetical protein
MINREDFPQMTPRQHFAEFKRMLQACRNIADVEEEDRKIGERIDYLFKKYILDRKNVSLTAMSVDELLERFEEICLVEDEVTNDYEEEAPKKYNECYDALQAVHEELKARGVEARRGLMRFYDHYNPQVRLKAATLSYRVAPEPARRCLEALRDTKLLGQRLAAGMTLRGIDDGTSMLD